VVTAGSAVSMRADLWWVWLLGAAAAGLGVVGLPASWDSFHALFRVVAVLAAAGAALSAASWPVRVAASVAAVLFHFSGVFSAATSPPPRPWLTEQMFTRVYNPYLQFIYMRNAYQFYSPNPGPASILAFLIKTETGTEKLPDGQERKLYKTQWVVMPRRPADIRDPLGLSYYRRLSLTQQVASANSAFAIPTDGDEKRRLFGDREAATATIPYYPFYVVPYANQFAIPNPEVIRFVLPSYASHVVMEHAYQDAAKTTVKVYRLDHQTLAADHMQRKLPNGEYPSPYHPGTYRPYYLGEFNARGDLVNPKDPLLYWLLPVLPRFPGPGDPVRKTYTDYLSAHALDMTIDDVLKADEQDGRVFNWGQLKWSETR